MAIKHLALPVKLVFKNKEEIAPNVYQFNFVPDKSLHWKAGQHGLLEIMLPNGKTGRKPFSVSSSPAEGVISVTTRADKITSSAFKRALLKLKKGSTAKMRGPVGRLYVKHPTKHYVMLATGIGITPFRAILTQLAHEKSKQIITLFYVNSKDGHYYRDQLSDLNKQLPNLTINYIYRPERLTGHIIEDELGAAISECIFLLSGSTKMIRSYRRTLQGLGIAKKRIISDPFYGFHPYKTATEPLPDKQKTTA